MDWNCTWFVAWVGEIFDDVLFEDLKVQLFLPAGVEGEPAYFTFHFTIFGSVSIILGASGSELDDVITGFQFAGEFAKIIARGRLRFPWDNERR